MQVLNTITLLDGSAIMEIQMSYQELQTMAKVGIIEVLTEASRAYDVVDAEIANAKS